MFKHTKIVATIGPACQDVDTLAEMVREGMNVTRLNFSHGSYENHALLIKNIRKVEKITGEPIAIMQDLQGPKIRLGKMPDEGLEIKTNAHVVLNTGLKEYKGEDIPVNFPGLEKFLELGERLLIDDGHMEVKIKEIKKTKIYCKVIEGGIVKSNKGLNFPESNLDIPAMSEKDKEDLKFGLEMGVDAVALSFVHTAEDVKNLRKLITKYEGELKVKHRHSVLLIAKIERHEGVENLDEILEVADGIMVARGDLGLEMAAAEVPLVQKNIVAKANSMAKPVIVATQMLDSMQLNRRPTRAEVSDVANAVIDHADAVMLSNETATGKYPVLVVKTMAEIVRATEKSVYDDVDMPDYTNSSVEGSVTELSRNLAEQVGAKLILAASLSGETGRLLSRVRPPSAPILVATNSERVQRQLNFSWGVKPFVLPTCKSIEELAKSAIDYIKKEKIAKPGDKMVIVAGEPVGQAGKVNLLEVREV